MRGGDKFGTCLDPGKISCSTEHIDDINTGVDRAACVTVTKAGNDLSSLGLESDSNEVDVGKLVPWSLI